MFIVLIVIVMVLGNYEWKDKEQHKSDCVSRVNSLKERKNLCYEG